MAKVLHVMMTLPDKWGSDFQNFAHQSLNQHAHSFVALRAGKFAATHPSGHPYELLPRAVLRKFLGLRRCIAAFQPDVVVFHGMNYGFRDTLALLALYATSDIRFRAIWSIWGADVYRFQNRRPGVLHAISEVFRRRLLRRVLYVSTLVPGDAELARQRYAPAAELFQAFYPVSSVLDRPLVDRSRPTGAPFFIQVGNSASPNNEHDVAIGHLSSTAGNFRVLCPLAYGSRINAARVGALGTRLLGDRFVALDRMLAPDEYAKLQAGVLVAIFNHNRQQGLANILGLLFSGAKVYLRPDTTTFYFLRKLGLPVFDSLRLDGSQSLEDLAEYRPDLPRIQKTIAERFSTQAAATLWDDLIASVASRAPKPRPVHGPSGTDGMVDSE
jgi:dTDP-N-acetylfucosamine:lipid II N-acetylfucosaminyltransferase